MSTQIEWQHEYLAECVKDEIKLAFLHPKFRRRFNPPIVLTQTAPIIQAARMGHAFSLGGQPRLSFAGAQPSPPPCWRRDWSGAGPLQVELGLTIVHDQDEGTVSAGTGNRRRNTTERYCEHPSPDAATMAAIVRAAIAELEARAGQ